jgi:thioredoxin reductase (NADPH)
MEKRRVVIIGSGPAGFTAALYTARAQLNPLIIAGNTLGGQVALTHEIENYPGFPEPLSGMELVQKFQAQAEHFGAEVVFDSVTEVDFTTGSPFTIKTHNNTYLADSVIVTIGADPRKLKIPGEGELTGRGVSYCGTCDGFFFRGKDVVVVGGGDSAIEEAIFLTRFANSVNIIHRRDTLRAGVALRARADKNPKISYTWNTVVDEIIGTNGKVSHVALRNVETGETTQKPTDGIFIFIGHVPNSSFFDGQVAMTESGYIITDQRFRTSVEGVFAAGEIQDEIWRQVATSVGQGCSAAMSAIHWLEEHEDQLQDLGEPTAVEA